MDNQEKYNLNWQSVENNLEEGTSSGYKVAILETAKLLNQVLTEKKFSGRDLEERLNSARNIFTDEEKIEQVYQMRQKIIEQPYFDISSQETKETIANFYQMIVDVMESQPRTLDKLNIFKNINLKFKNVSIFGKGIIKKSLIGIFLFFLIVLILADTGPGQTLTNFLVDVAHFIFYKLLIISAIAAAIIIAIIGTLSYLENRHKNEIERMKLKNKYKLN
jgi:urease gamma subunit